MKQISQVTLAKEVFTKGVGLHSGKEINMILHPAEGHTGIVFHRSDETAGANAVLVSAEAVQETPLCSKVKNEHGVEVGTIEHLMAAFYAMGVDNVVVEIDGPEIPVMDGSAAPFINLIEQAGLRSLEDKKNYIKVLKEVSLKEDGREASVLPATSFSLDIEVDYNHELLPKQRKNYVVEEQMFRQELASARTFCFEKDVEAMREQGLAQGGSLENAVVIGENGILNEEPLRFEDEFLRHKALDCIGDFYLTGYPILGAFKVVKPGHSLNNRLLRALMADDTAWAWA